MKKYTRFNPLDICPEGFKMNLKTKRQPCARHLKNNIKTAFINILPTLQQRYRTIPKRKKRIVVHKAL